MSDGRESERNIVPIRTVQENAVYGKVPCFIHVCREGKSERMAKLDLKLHPVKTKIVSMWDGKEGFDFLGMHHRRMTRGTYQSKLAGRLFSTFCMVRSVHKFFTKN